jgi:DNA repair photolyase
MFLPQNRRPREQWGRWLEAKLNAVELARRDAAKVGGKCVYLSTVTDPYLPAERTLKLTRGILEEILPFQPRLLVQTRGPLVVRDVDVLKGFTHIRVNLSIPTDSEGIRKTFEPKAPPLQARWDAASALKSCGIPVGISITPVLPIDNVMSFARRLTDFGAKVVVVEDFHDSHGKFGGDTGPAAKKTLVDRCWGAEEYQGCVSEMRKHLKVYQGEKGFFPP